MVEHGGTEPQGGGRRVRKTGLFVLITRHRRALAPFFDVWAWALAMVAGAAVRLGGDLSDVPALSFAAVVLAAVAVQLGLGYRTGLYRGRWRVATFEEILGLGLVWASASLVAIGLNLFFADRPFPVGAVIAGAVFAGALMFALRGLWRMLLEYVNRPNHEARRVVVFGAGEGGYQVIRAMMRDPESAYLPVGILDDDPAKARRSISGVRVMGGLADLHDVVQRVRAEILLIAVPSASGALVRELSRSALDAGLEVRILPRPHDLPSDFGVGSIAKVTEVDLLGRDEVTVDLQSIVH
jgi:FlaA1/EpsC-like NDP-sugar epimerase